MDYFYEFDNYLIKFDDDDKSFSLFMKAEIEETGEEEEAEEEEEEETEVEYTRRKLSPDKICPECGQKGHDRRAHRNAGKGNVRPWKAKCLDCDWTGSLKIPLLDATCPEGHIHITKVK